MRLVSLIVTMVVASVLTFYVLTCSVNNAPPAPVHPIVGKWRMEIFCGQPTVEGVNVVCEFSADGSYVVENTSIRNGTEQFGGSYVINQDVISTLCPPGQAHTAAPGHTTAHIVFSESNNRISLESDNSRGAESYVRVK